MTRYAETFFRYWLIALVPIVVLPMVGYAMIRGTPKTVLTSAKIWVNSSVTNSSSNVNQYMTPAQVEQGTLNQLLQISSFDTAVARGSTLYMQMLLKQPDASTYLQTDLTKNAAFTPAGDNLLVVSYSSQNWQLGTQVVQSLLSAALNQTQLLSQQQTTLTLHTYESQLRNAQQQLKQSTKQLTSYMREHGITANDITTQMTVDTTFASLYTQVQSDQSNVASIRQKITALQTANAGGAAAQSDFRVVDAPSTIIVTSKKKELMNLALYLVGGLVLGLGFVVGKTLTDRSLRYVDEVPETLDLPVLAVIPYTPALAPANRGTSLLPGLRRIG